MKKSPILNGIILLLSTPLVFAGQGLYLKINSYLPNTQAIVTASNCVDGTEKINTNVTTYLEANNNGVCFFQKSWLTVSLQKNSQEIKSYTITISDLGSNLTTPGLSNLNDNMIAATLYPHYGAGTQDWVTLALSPKEDNWMTQMDAALANKPLRTVILPGTHDTGTYGINDHSEIAADIDDTLKFWLQFDALKIQHLKSWSITQNFDVSTQLTSGIRYLDLRLCKTSNGSLATCHSLVGDNVENILNAVSSFINAPNHNKELVILDFNHMGNLTNDDIDTLAGIMIKNFGDKIAAAYSFNSNSPLSSFWDQRKQIIAIIANDYATTKYPQLFWNENSISSPWPDKQSSNELIQAMQNALSSRYQPELFVLQSQETPSTDTIISGFNPFAANPDSLLKLTTSYKPSVDNWFAQKNNQMMIRQNGNIIIEDFSNGIDLAELAKKLNA